MVSRYSVRCLSCNGRLLLRIGIGPVLEQSLLCQCPHCKVALRIRVETPGPPVIRLSSSDVEQVTADEKADAQAPVLVLYADLPVHVSMLGKPAGADGFPFINMTGLWGDRAPEYTARS